MRRRGWWRRRGRGWLILLLSHLHECVEGGELLNMTFVAGLTNVIVSGGVDGGVERKSELIEWGKAIADGSPPVAPLTTAHALGNEAGASLDCR